MRKKHKLELTADRLRELLHYDPETGIFTWRMDRINRKAGDVAGRVEDGYLMIGVDDRAYGAHRLAVLYVTGSWPTHMVDHEDGDTLNNRYKNLRPCTTGENQQNRKSARPNGQLAGVTFDRAAKRYKARIGVSRKQITLGYFNTPTEAHAAYVAAKAKYHAFQPTLRGADATQ